MHLRVGSHPLLALNGREIPLTASPTLTKEIWRKLVFSFMTSEQIEQLAQQKKLELPLDLKEVGLFRALVSVTGDVYNLSIVPAVNGSPPPAGAAAPASTAREGMQTMRLGPVKPGVPKPVLIVAPPETAGEPPVAPVAPAAAAPAPAAAAPAPAPAPAPAAAAPAPAAAEVASAPAVAKPAAAEPPAASPPPAAVPAFVGGPLTSDAAPTHTAAISPESAAVVTVGLINPLGPPVPATHPYRDGDVHVDELLSILLDKGGSDLHLHEGKVAVVRASGHLVIAHEKKLDSYNMMAMIETVTNEQERALLFAKRDLDTSYNLKSLSRFRVNVLHDTRGYAMVLRVIPFKIPDWKDLGVPETARGFVYKPHGLFLVTGPTGSGKSTTLASLIHDVNQTQYKHIVTIEDPIEFVHNDIKSCITQREVGVDTPSFARGVIDVLRQDPDLILVGEMRDLETMSNALLAAESGRLVLATLHTTSASQTIERIINVFPEEAQGVARTQLANSLVGILSQALLAKKGGGRVAAFEVMVAVESVRNLIKENKPQMLQTTIETGAKFGMKSLDQHLLELIEGGQVTFEDAYGKCQNTKNFKALEAKLKGVPISSLPEE